MDRGFFVLTKIKEKEIPLSKYLHLLNHNASIIGHEYPHIVIEIDNKSPK
jgi:hypothetical protein